MVGLGRLGGARGTAEESVVVVGIAGAGGGFGAWVAGSGA